MFKPIHPDENYTYIFGYEIYGLFDYEKYFKNVRIKRTWGIPYLSSSVVFTILDHVGILCIRYTFYYSWLYKTRIKYKCIILYIYM